MADPLYAGLKGLMDSAQLLQKLTAATEDLSRKIDVVIANQESLAARMTAVEAATAAKVADADAVTLMVAEISQTAAGIADNIKAMTRRVEANESVIGAALTQTSEKVSSSIGRVTMRVEVSERTIAGVVGTGLSSSIDRVTTALAKQQEATAENLRLQARQSEDSRKAQADSAAQLRAAAEESARRSSAELEATRVKLEAFLAKALGDVATSKFTPLRTTDVRTCRAAGFSAAQCMAGGFAPKDLKAGGFTALEFKAGGADTAQCRAAGFSLKELKAGGFDAAQCRAAGFDAAQCRAAGFTLQELKAGGFDTTQCRAAGFPPCLECTTAPGYRPGQAPGFHSSKPSCGIRCDECNGPNPGGQWVEPGEPPGSGLVGWW